MAQTRKLNGPAVRVIRELHGLKLREFAQRAAVDPGYLSKLESGARQPTLEVMLRIARGLGVPLEVVSYPIDMKQRAA